MGSAQYRLAEETVKLEGNDCKTFGIIVEQGKKEIAWIHDVSCVRERIELLVNRCNRLQPDPLHLFDVIEDFLME